MQKFPLDLGLGSAPGENAQQGGARHINCYVKKASPGSKVDRFLNAIPGLKRWDSGSYSGQVRGLQKINDDVMYGVLGNQVVKFEADGTDTAIGGIPGTGRVHTAQNMKTTTQVGLVTDDRQFFIIENDQVIQVTDGDLPAPNSVAFLDGYFLLTVPDGRFYWTSINEGTEIDALDFVTAESNADGLVAGIDYGGFYYAFGTETFEAWKNTGVSKNQFQPIQQDSEYGLMAGHALKKSSKGLIWPDHNGRVQVMQGGHPVEVSTSDVVRAINGLSASQQASLEADIEIAGDQETYILSSDSFTWCWNVKTGTWHERESKGHNRTLRNVSEFFAGKHLFGSIADGAIYEVDEQAYNEAGLEMVMRCILPNLNAFPHRIRCSSLEIDAVTGVGANSGISSDDEPLIMLRWSDDGQKTWSNTRQVNLGSLGDSKQEIKFRKLGQIGKAGRNFEISISASVFRSIMSATVFGDILR